MKEKVKFGNVLYVDGLKHNLLSVSQMCDQGIEAIFRSNGCSVRDLDTGKTVIKGIRTPNNSFIWLHDARSAIETNLDAPSPHLPTFQEPYLFFLDFRTAHSFFKPGVPPSVPDVPNLICYAFFIHI